MQKFEESSVIYDDQAVPLYKVWPANNIFIFKGKFITGKPNVDTSILITILAHIVIVLYSIFIAPYMLRTYPLVLYLQGLLLVISATFFYCTMFTDPGYIPKKVVFENTHWKQIPFPFNGKQDSIVNLNDSIGYLDTSNQEKNKIIPKNEEKSEGQTKIQIVLDQSCYCQLCQIYRPPRTYHCEKCNNCVEIYDHHCAALNVCIGKRNYKFFMGLLLFSSILIITVLLAVGSYIHHNKWHTLLHFDTLKNKIVTVVVCLSLICALMNSLGYFLGMLGNNLVSMILRKPMQERNLNINIKLQKNLVLPYYKFFKHERSLFDGQELINQTQAQNIKTFANNQQF